MTSATDGKTVYLIDGTAQLFRAYFAIRGLTNAEGLPTNAVFGFTTMLRKLIAEERPQSIAVAFDLAGDVFRHETYAEYKARKTGRIMERVLALLPQLEGHFMVLGSSTPLTFRDYLHSPDGSAYGVKQKMGQFNLLGRLPLRNLYAAGQSSVLPGVMGAMVSSFMVCRTLLGAEKFDADIQQRLDA